METKKVVLHESVTEFEDYRLFLRAWIAQAPNKGRGQKSALARAAGCQPSYLSQVFSGLVDLSIEQAERISHFIGLRDWEVEYLVLLVERERAATVGLKRMFQNRLEQIRAVAKRLKSQISEKAPLTEAQRNRYYSAWYYSAIHILLTIPNRRTPESISKYLKVPLSTVVEALNFLLNIGLVRLKAGEYETTEKRMHLDDDSPQIVSWHSQWRQQALINLTEHGSARLETDLHYTSVVSLSHKDAGQLRQRLMKVIAEYNATVAESLEETLYCLGLDFFGVSKKST